jgi:hypothetical protein
MGHFYLTKIEKMKFLSREKIISMKKNATSFDRSPMAISPTFYEQLLRRFRAPKKLSPIFKHRKDACFTFVQKTVQKLLVKLTFGVTLANIFEQPLRQNSCAKIVKT